MGSVQTTHTVTIEHIEIGGRHCWRVKCTCGYADPISPTSGLITLGDAESSRTQHLRNCGIKVK